MPSPFIEGTLVQYAQKVDYILASGRRLESGCLECHLRPNKKGYAVVRMGRATLWRASRLIMEYFYGPIPKGKLVLHKCDNRRCIEPTHLYIGTAKQNTADMIQRGRHANQYRRGPNA